MACAPSKPLNTPFVVLTELAAFDARRLDFVAAGWGLTTAGGTDTDAVASGLDTDAVELDFLFFAELILTNSCSEKCTNFVKL